MIEINARDRTFDKIIKFIEDHPEQCSCDAYNFRVGDLPQFWVANGAHCGDALKGGNIPKHFWTHETRERFYNAYVAWTEKHFDVTIRSKEIGELESRVKVLEGQVRELKDRLPMQVDKSPRLRCMDLGFCR